MPAEDLFTLRRLAKSVETFRKTTGQLPTLSDLEKAGFSSTLVDKAVKKKMIKALYVTLTSGAVVKGYKVL